MQVHRDAVLKTHGSRSGRSGRVTVTQVHPAVLATARLLATGDRRVVVVSPTVALVLNGQVARS